MVLVKNILLCFIVILFFNCAQKPTSLIDLTTFTIPEDFQIELIASEPLISDPVDMAIDEYGRMMVVEMHGYPLDLSGSGVVKQLIDTDDDGLPDQSKIFAEGLVLPTGIMRWKEGWIVSDPPNVIYFEDTNNDGKADIKETLLTGFARSNPQHNVNNPMYGIDNWIYLSHEGAVHTEQFGDILGDEGKKVHYPDIKDGPLLPQNANGFGVRFKPDQKLLESLSSSGQFGHAFDPSGHHFLTSNATHLFHEVLPAAYIKRNKNLLISSARNYIPKAGIGFEIYPITTNPNHQLLTDIGMLTSACGILWYDGGLLPDKYENTVFTAEPVHNLIHLDKINKKGVTFEAINFYENKEFLASTDSWFRPVNQYVGPDGAIYILDYHRKIIEHPEWLSDEIINSGDLTAGTDKGRIYRLTPKGSKPMNFLGKLKLVSFSIDDLILKLEEKNSWWRLHAQRLLMDKDDPDILYKLEKFIAKTSSSQAKLHALWILEGKNQTKLSILKSTLGDPSPGVRENTIKIIENHIHNKTYVDILYSLKNETSPMVRHQMLLTLGGIEGEKIIELQKSILIQDIEDPWLHYAALTATNINHRQWFEWAIKFYKNNETEGSRLFIKRLVESISASATSAEINQILTVLINSKSKGWTEAYVIEGITKALQKNQDIKISNKNIDALFRQVFNASNSKLKPKILNLLYANGYFNKKENELYILAKKAFQSTNSKTIIIQDALLILGWTAPNDNIELLKNTIENSSSSGARVSALKALAYADGSKAGPLLTTLWANLQPAERKIGINIFLGNEGTRLLLLQNINDQKIQATNLAWGQKVSLLNSSNNEIRQLARSVLKGSQLNADEVWKEYSPSLKLNGNKVQGAKVFKLNCGNCHQVSGQNGTAIGPDLASIKNRNKASILLDILQPNRAIGDAFELWTVMLTSGKSLSGIITNESPTSITIKDLAGAEEIKLRKNIQSIKAHELSAMPEGLHNQMSIKEVADLLEYLKN